MRPIDADALLEKFNRKTDIWTAITDEDTAGDFAVYCKLADAVEEMPTIYGWISVKDRLPELEEEVLVYASGKIDGFFGKHATAICSRYVQKIFPSAPGHEIWSTPWQYFHTDYEITHWMPLPEPPEEDEA